MILHSDHIEKVALRKEIEHFNQSLGSSGFRAKSMPGCADCDGEGELMTHLYHRWVMTNYGP